MKALSITGKGIEDISALEIKELIGAKTEEKDSCVIFRPKKIEDLCTLCYKSQSTDKILFLFDHFDFNKNLLEKIKTSIDNIDLSKWLNKKNSFMVSCQKDTDEISSEELCAKAGEIVIYKIKKTDNYNQKVNLKTPDVIFFIYLVKNTCYIGIDFSGIDLHKRTYRIFLHSSSLRATIAYSLVRIADFKDDESLLDPCTGAGTIPIEAVLFKSNLPVNYFNKDRFAFLKLKDLNIDANKIFEKIDKKILTTKGEIYGYDSFLGNITNAKKNAKIAGTQKQITFSRIDIGWLDTKFEKGVIDKIIVNPPKITNQNKKDVEKVYKDIFYQADFILNKKGKIVTISETTDVLKKYAEEYKFKPTKERTVFSGKAPLKILVFER